MSEKQKSDINNTGKNHHDYSLKNYTTGWDIRTTAIPPINNKFFDKFVVKQVQGEDDYVSVDGLISLAHEKGYSGDDVELIQSPTKENGMTCIVKVTIHGLFHNKYTGEVVERKWSSLGDASPTSIKNKWIHSALIRMAETRARGRALRHYLNMAMVTDEEIGSVLQQKNASKKQLEFIKELYEKKDVDKTEYRKFLQNTIGRKTLTGQTKNNKKINPTEVEAQVVIDYLKMCDDLLDDDDKENE